MTQAEEDKFVCEYFDQRCKRGYLCFHSVVLEHQCEMVRNVMAKHSYVTMYSLCVKGWVQVSAVLIYCN